MTHLGELQEKTLSLSQKCLSPLKERVRLAKSADEIREALEAWLTVEVQTS
jgi:hypothetical protein